MKLQRGCGPQQKEKSGRLQRRITLKLLRYWKGNLVTSLTLGEKHLGLWTFLLSPSTAGSMRLRPLENST
ncbi:hypothetical protein CFP56_035271 [Quercus suber]|uniref:Uncharacterized protein n=1 Tax=Quercus suber TaxID=58331 RepID=A0AAW0JA24_QUESU